MDDLHLSRHQLVKRLTEAGTENVSEVALRLWEQIASQIVSIVGDGGFDSLFVRSVYLTQPEFPWLVVSSGFAQTHHRFADLKASLDGQSAALAIEANCQLLITFTDILASLVGEPLTARILDSAWEHGAQERDAQERAGKEFKDE